MKTPIRLTLLVVVIVCSPAIFAGGPQVSLKVDAHETLAGIAVPLHIRVTNPGRAFRLDRSVSIDATPLHGGNSVRIVGRMSPTFGIAIDDEEISWPVDERGSIEFTLPSKDWYSDDSWALNPNLLLEGGWSLRVNIYDANADSEGEQYPLATSNPIELHIVEPKGPDKEIWDAFIRGEGRSLAESVMRDHPESPYFPYVAPMANRGSASENVKIVELALKLHPDTPVAPWLQYLAGTWYESASRDAWFGTGDRDEATRLSDVARAAYLKLGRYPDLWSKSEARIKLRDLLGKKEFGALAKGENPVPRD